METCKAARGMTREELLALPVAVDLDTANKALTIGRSTGYALAKRASTRSPSSSWATHTGWLQPSCIGSSA